MVQGTVQAFVLLRRGGADEKVSAWRSLEFEVGMRRMRRRRDVIQDVILILPPRLHLSRDHAIFPRYGSAYTVHTFYRPQSSKFAIFSRLPSLKMSMRKPIHKRSSLVLS